MKKHEFKEGNNLNNEITNSVQAANKKAQYDDRVKRLLAQKSILAHILVKTVDEFRGMNPKDVVRYIEGEPYIGVVPVEPGLTNVEKSIHYSERIVGMNTECSEINEGVVRFDIIFYVRMRDGITQMIINIEAQKDEPKAYNILNRAIFYVCRMVSSQKERDFTNTNYDDIKRVVSIWICMNKQDNSMNHYHLTNDALLGRQKWEGKEDILSIVIIGVSDELPVHDENYELHRLLATLLSNSMSENEKLRIIEKEYDIPAKEEIRKEVRAMCNLSQGIVDNTIIKIVLNMYSKGYSIEQISESVEFTSEKVKEIIENKGK